MDISKFAIPAELGIADREIVRIAQDRICKNIPITPLANDLLMTEDVQRQFQQSLLGIMTGMSLYNVGATRGEHLLAAYFLGLIVTRLPELRPYRPLLTAALTTHDVGHPPHPHSAEPAMKTVLGNGHESAFRAHYKDRECAHVMEKNQVLFDEVAQLIDRTHPNPVLQALVNGGKHPDLESWEGTCRYALTWTHAGAPMPYDPVKIAYCYRLNDKGQLILQEIEGFCNLELEIERAQKCREEVFETIHGPSIEGPEVLLARAMQFAVEGGHLTEKFFFLSDEQATQHLRTKCGAIVRRLIERTLNGNHHHLIYERRFRLPSEPQKAIMQDLPNRQLFADRVAEELHIPRADICVQLCRFKGYKDYRTMVVLSASGEPIHIPHYEPYWLAHAYVSEEHEPKQEAVAQILDELLLLR